MSLLSMSPTRLREQLAGRSVALTASRAVRQSLLSIVGLVGTPVVNQTGEEVGRLVDVVVRLDGPTPYPAVSGLVVRIGRRRAFLDIGAVADLSRSGVRLATARFDLREFIRRPGEAILAGDVLDHQLVDTDGVQVIRAADLYLARVGDTVRLVGVDVSLQTLLRRLGPRRWHARPTPERVIDWAGIAPFGEQDTEVPGTLRLRASREALRRLRPAELADLLEDLGRIERYELLNTLDPAQAADALEEMHADQLQALLRETPPAQAARLLGEMEPDEAAEALRGFSPQERDPLLAQMPVSQARQLRRLLTYRAGTAGGVMTTRLVTAAASDTIAEVTAALGAQAEHHTEIDAVAVLDEQDRLVADVPLFDLLVTEPSITLGTLLGQPGHDHVPVTVNADSGIAEVAERLVDSRCTSLLVLDAQECPIGRILADDLVDALLPQHGRYLA
jgi:CBS domain-containing protein